MLHAHCNLQYPGGGGTPLIGLNGYVPLNRVSRLKQGIQFYLLESCTGCLSGLEALNPTCGYQQIFKSHSMMSFIKKYFLYRNMEIIYKADKKSRTQTKYKVLFS